MPRERLQRILARAGLGSRRTCEKLITGGHVTIDDQLATELGATADPLVSSIRVDGQLVQQEQPRYVILHKPSGYLSNPDARSGLASWLNLVSVPERLFPVGRLDLDSEGLLLLTNDGELSQRLIHPRFEHVKTYLVQVVGLPNPRKLRRLRHSIMLDDGPTAPAEVTLLHELPAGLRGLAADHIGTRVASQAAHHALGPGSSGRKQIARRNRRESGGDSLQRTSWLKVSLREGRKRQLRRMVARVGHPALRVIRIAIGPLELGQLPPGKWRELGPAEIETLRAVLRLEEGSSSDASARTGTRPSPPRAARKSLQESDPRGRPTKPALPRIIALDGPSASGKSTVGRLLARKLGYLYFDTGVMYRAVAYLALKRGIPLTDEAAISALARRVVLQVLPPNVPDGRDVTVLADGADITWDIRSQDVEKAVSPVSAFSEVRAVLRQAQRTVGLAGRVVMVGRDIGTVVIPEADLKIYLDASLSVRAQRRYRERLARGGSASLEEVLADIRTRDEIDSTRAHAPLAAAPDAIVMDTTSLTVEEVVEGIAGLFLKKQGGNGER
jgi:CMP/dCMP kinase